MDPLENADLLTEVIRALVDDPQAVRVEEAARNGSTYLTIHVASDDKGKVLGKEGTTIRSLRVLFGRIGAVEGRKIYLRLGGDRRFG